MGSWANSIHVKHNDPQAVIAAIQALIPAAGGTPASAPRPVAAPFPNILPFEERGEGGRADEDDDDEEWDAEDGEGVDDDEDDEGMAFDDEDGPRRVCVYRPCKGWVGVLDSEPCSDLGRQLSARLMTDAMMVAVNDSDWWAYELYRNGLRFDAFNSCGDVEDEGALSPELEAAMARGDRRTVERLMEEEMLRHAPRGPIFMPDGETMLPPEMALLRARIREGRAWFWEHPRYWWMWVRFLWRVYRGRHDFAETGFGFDIPRTAPLDGEALGRHVRAIREMFPDAPEAELRELLPLSRFPAEDLLVKFLKTVGLPGLYGYLCYRYLEDHGTRELAREGNVRVAELRFM